VNSVCISWTFSYPWWLLRDFSDSCDDDGPIFIIWPSVYQAISYKARSHIKATIAIHQNSLCRVYNNPPLDYRLITNLMHWLLFIHRIIFSSTRFESQVFIFRRIQLFTCSIWYCHPLWELLVACRYTAWVRTGCRGKVVGGCLKTPANNFPLQSVLT